MKQIKSNNWLDLLVRFFLRSGDFHLLGQLQNQSWMGKRGTFPRGRRFVRLPWIFPLYNNVLSLRLLFLMRMMFISFIIVSCVLIYCVCVCVCLFVCFYFLVFPLLYISSVLRFRDYFVFNIFN